MGPTKDGLASAAAAVSSAAILVAYGIVVACAFAIFLCCRLASTDLCITYLKCRLGSKSIKSEASRCVTEKGESTIHASMLGIEPGSQSKKARAPIPVR
jgi:hypothetical protein